MRIYRRNQCQQLTGSRNSKEYDVTNQVLQLEKERKVNLKKRKGK